MIEHSQTYLGCIERNYWGTSFEIYDYGLDQKTYSKMPNYLGTLRKKLVFII